MADEILINATRVSSDNSCEIYEFVIDSELRIVECVYVESLAEGNICPVPNYGQILKGVLFELNHVRVNPRVDNTFIIERLTSALEDIGVNVSNQPDNDAMSVCFKPLGEISDNVRFYFYEDGQFIFLSPATRPKIVAVNNAQGLN